MQTTVRFFSTVWDDVDGLDIVEITESCFLSLDGKIEYERHTVFSNGVSQVCLTKDCFDIPAIEDLELVQ